jgi:hypothetical protein
MTKSEVLRNEAAVMLAGAFQMAADDIAFDCQETGGLQQRMKTALVIACLSIVGCQKSAPPPGAAPTTAVQIPASKVEPIQEAAVVECIRPYVPLPPTSVEAPPPKPTVNELKIGESGWVSGGIWTGRNRKAYIQSSRELVEADWIKYSGRFQVRREKGGFVLMRALEEIMMSSQYEDYGGADWLPIISVPAVCQPGDAH